MSSWFDDLSRTLASPMPRRKALRSVGALMGGAFLAGVLAKPAKAAQGGCGSPCNVQSDCTSGTCTGTGGTCVCGSGLCCCSSGACSSTATGGNCPSSC